MMKTIVILVFLLTGIIVSESKVFPDYLSKPCEKLQKNYDDCWTKTLREWGPHLLNGVQEIHFPKLSPLHIPVFIINRTVNGLFSVNTFIRDLKFSGFNTTSLRSFRFDPHTYQGELQLDIQQIFASVKYNATGYLFDVSLESSGHMKIISNDLYLKFNFQFKIVEKLGVKYFELDQFKAAGTVGNALIKINSKNPQKQPSVDLIVKFFNENSKLILETVNPVYEEIITYFYGSLFADVLRRVPANEFVPE